MKKIFCLLVFSTYLIVPTVHASARTEELLLQIQALEEYVSHLTEPAPQLSSSDEATIILDGAKWVITSQETNGHFGYEYVPFVGEYNDDDNMVRQAGTLSALADVYKRQIKPDVTMAEAIESSIEYLESVTVKVADGEGEFWCVLREAGGVRCDLGTSALLLVGILNYVEAEPSKVAKYEEHIANYVAYLLRAKRDAAGFSNRYLTTSGFSSEESPFYNGEAMLALVRYYQFAEDADIKEMLHDLFYYLSAKEYESPLYLWIMAALKDMQALWPNEDFVAYAKDFTEHRLTDAGRRHATTHNYCAPVEGMTSAYSVLHGEVDPGLLSRLYSEIEFWLGKTAWLQLNADSPYRVLREDNEFVLKKVVEPKRAHGGFLTGETELTQRIDFTQHCVSAYVQKYADIDGGEL